VTRRRSRRSVGVAVALAISSAAGYSLVSGRPDGAAGSIAGRLSQLRASHGYQLFYLGASVGAQRLSSVLSDQVPTAYSSVERTQPTTRVERFDLIYGECTPSGGGFFEGGTCTPPLDVQEVPACALNATVLGPPDRRVRGVPAYWDGDTLRLYTATTTITIFGDRGLPGALSVAAHLRSLNGRQIGPASPLPAPTRFQLQGGQRCRDGD
jgi:hypothetical protein